MPKVICPVIKDYCCAAEKDSFDNVFCQINGERVVKGDECPDDSAEPK